MNEINPQQTIFYSIENAIKTYRKYAQKKIAEKVDGITIDQVLILTVLETEPSISQKDIAELLFKDYASITRMIELLVKNDYLSRSINEHDRRKFNLVISSKGYTTLKKLKPVILQNRSEALNGVTKAEVAALSTTLSKIINNCK